MSTPATTLVIGFPGQLARRVAAELARRTKVVTLLHPPALEVEAAAFAATLPGKAGLVSGDLEHIDLGLAGCDYRMLASRLESIVLAALPPPPRPEESAPAGAEAIREVFELALAAPGPAHVVLLSHVDVAGGFADLFAERDLDLGQRFQCPSARERFVVERICRRMTGRVPLNVVRGGWPVGQGPGLALLIAMLLAAGDELTRFAARRLSLSHVDGLARVLAGLVRHPPGPGGRVLHAVDPSFPTVERMSRLVAAEAGELAPGSFDLVTGARRMLQRSAEDWQPRDFFSHQPQARIATAWSERFAAAAGLPSAALGDEETSTMIEHAIEGIVGLR